jgi:hypothetical protein
MTPQEANKIIAEFMDEEIRADYWRLEDIINKQDPELITIEKIEYAKLRIVNFFESDIVRYSESLDALVPAWEKLKNDFIMDLRQHFGYHKGYKYFIRLIGRGDNSIYVKGEHVSFSIQQAAAIATAKAIQELT